MIRKLAARLPGYLQVWEGRYLGSLLAYGVIGTLIACNLTSVMALQPPTSTPTTHPTSPPPVSAVNPTLDSGLSLSVPTGRPTAQPAGHETGPAQDYQTGAAATKTVPPGRTPTAGAAEAPTVTLPPTPLPPAPTRAALSVSQGELVLPTYPYRDYMKEEFNALYGIPVLRLDRAAYEASAPGATPRSYRTLVVENLYLRLSFVPELGGRLYSVVVKSTGQEIFYHNPVVKPSRYGPLLPVEDNWWLAIGGMEWAFPVHEHGYAWSWAWAYDVVPGAERITVALYDSREPGRVRAEVQVSLPANGATFSIRPRLINATDHTVPVQFWLNALLAPGSASVPPSLRFIAPVGQVVVHSRGEMGWALPQPGDPMSWPLAAGRDLSCYDQWADYLGFFIPFMPSNFMALYNPDADVGIARIVPPGQIPGHKFFAFGLNFSDRGYTDDHSQYAEMWGGANPDFRPESDIPLAPGETIEWRETWWPVAGLAGLTFANESVAFNLLNGSRLRILSSQETTLTLVALSHETELLRVPLALNPIQPIEFQLPETGGSPIQIRLVTSNGDLVADYPGSAYP